MADVQVNVVQQNTTSIGYLSPSSRASKCQAIAVKLAFNDDTTRAFLQRYRKVPDTA